MMTGRDSKDFLHVLATPALDDLRASSATLAPVRELHTLSIMTIIRRWSSSLVGGRPSTVITVQAQRILAFIYPNLDW